MRYVSIVKPGIIFGNIITLLGGFFLGSFYPFSWWTLFAATLGMIAIIASGCVFNNIIDRDIDAVMERTKQRVMVKKLISVPAALSYACALAILGFFILYQWTNPLATLIAFIGFFVYVVFYSLYAKRQSQWGTLIGAIAGAVPPVVGYCAVQPYLNKAALLLFLLLFFWQIPHFNAIAILRLSDYVSAKIPVLPARHSILTTKLTSLLCVICFAIIANLIFILGLAGKFYLLTTVLVSLCWIILTLWGFITPNYRKWSKYMFMTSIINITMLSAAMAID